MKIRRYFVEGLGKGATLSRAASYARALAPEALYKIQAEYIQVELCR